MSLDGPVPAQEIRDAGARLARLLADPHPGLLTWSQSFGLALEAVKKISQRALEHGVIGLSETDN